MVKEPKAGRVKTRLGHDIGLTASAWWFRHAVRRLLRRLEDPRWDIVLAVAPDGALHTRCFPMRFRRLPQGSGDLGDRMARMMRSVPPGPVCVIGADIPGITPTAIWRAFRVLGRADAVFGPSDDGGYWLVGAHNAAQVPRSLFTDVRWSTAHALSDTVASIPDARIAFVDELVDVDTAADLARA